MFHRERYRSDKAWTAIVSYGFKRDASYEFIGKA